MALSSIIEAIGEAVSKNRRNQPSLDISPQARFNILSILLAIIPAVVGILLSTKNDNPVFAIIGIAIGVVAMQSPKVAKQWERGIILRLGKFTGLRGPGVFWIVPFFESVTEWIDQRVVTTSFAAEQTLTMDTVPVNVDAVLFWMVHDAEKAALEVQDYSQAVSWAAQTAW